MGATSKRGWLTPSDAPEQTIVRRIFIPVGEPWLAIVSGALLPLTRAENWERFGLLLPEEAAARAQVMYLKFLRDAGMLGYIFPFAGAEVPEDCVECDGATYFRTEYPALYDWLDSTYHIDADSFRTPDLRGRTVIGAGQGVGLSERLFGDTGGEEQHQLTVPELARHAHIYTPPIPNVDLEAPGVPDVVAAGLGPDTYTADTGDDEPHNNMQPFIVLRYVMVAK